MQADSQTNANSSVDLISLKREVDALQVAILAQNTPWYRSMSAIISMVALLFSFGTTIVSYVRTQNQDIQSARIELRGLLQRLANLPRENVEITKKYEGDPAAIAAISGFINQENALLARQAAEIANKIPQEYMSATEYYAISAALQAAYNIDGAMELVTKAIDTSNDLSDRVAALRMRANLLYLSGQPDAGRVDYQRALNVFSDFANIYNDYTKKSTHIWTELAWAYSEASIGFKDVALQHIGNAENHLSGLIASPGADQLGNSIRQAKTLLSAEAWPSDSFQQTPLSQPSPLTPDKPRLTRPSSRGSARADRGASRQLRERRL